MVNKKNYTIGVIGGMGSYATIDFFKRLVDAFPVEKEWDRPRIIIDNYCTMPSRVRAILFNENVDELINCLINSTKNLINIGANRIILACNTSHFFLNDIICSVPESKNMFINIIEECAKNFKQDDSIELIASEGTIDSGIYRRVFDNYCIDFLQPDSSKYEMIRIFIEAVKQNKINQEVLNMFFGYIENSRANNIILGCTELPILYAKCLENSLIPTKRILDPLQASINVLTEEYNSLL